MRRLPAAGLFMIAALVAAAPAVTAKTSSTPTNVDVSQRHLNESEEAIAVNPTNPNNIVIVTNVGHREAGLSAGMFEGISFDGGKTWANNLIGANNDNLGDACCDPSLDRKSTRLNSSHRCISYAVFCLKKKKKTKNNINRQANRGMSSNDQKAHPDTQNRVTKMRWVSRRTRLMSQVHTGSLQRGVG